MKKRKKLREDFDFLLVDFDNNDNNLYNLLSTSVFLFVFIKSLSQSLLLLSHQMRVKDPVKGMVALED